MSLDEEGYRKLCLNFGCMVFRRGSMQPPFLLLKVVHSVNINLVSANINLTSVNIKLASIKY